MHVPYTRKGEKFSINNSVRCILCSTQAKKKARKNLGISAKNIVTDIIIKLQRKGEVPARGLPNQENIVRAVNRDRASRRPAHPSSLDFEVYIDLHLICHSKFFPKVFHGYFILFIFTIIVR